MSLEWPGTPVDPIFEQVGLGTLGFAAPGPGSFHNLPGGYPYPVGYYDYSWPGAGGVGLPVSFIPQILFPSLPSQAPSPTSPGGAGSIPPGAVIPESPSGVPSSTALDPDYGENAMDWGDALLSLGYEWLRQTAGLPGITGPVQGMSLTSGGPSMPTTTFEVDPNTGAVSKKKCRRRRRRLLTPTDLSDLAALKSIVGNSDALKFAVTKAVRR